jgi:ribosomal protein L11 methyltransferase
MDEHEADWPTERGSRDGRPACSPWIVELSLASSLTMPDGEVFDRLAFVEHLWARCGDDGLVGIDEGAIDVDEASALGLTTTPLVLDAAAAPRERDWIAGLPSAVVTCWFSSEAAAREAAAGLEGIAGCRVAAVRPEAQPQGTDDTAWQRTFTPLEVPGFGLVCPPWDVRSSDPGGPPVIVIDPGSGFGTGLHETTRLCLAAVTRGFVEIGGRRVLDFGSGSGILGIAAAVLGAAEVDAVEIDDRVHDAIRANASASGVAERVRVTAALPTCAAYDLVVANIVADVLLAEAATLAARVRVGGRLVLSGLVDDDVPAVSAGYARHLGTTPTVTSAGGWHCLEFTRPTPG